MAIVVQCPKGHRLSAAESSAGRNGRCPVCKAVVSIPVSQQTLLTESTILSILGTADIGGTAKQAAASKQQGSYSMPGSASVVSDDVKAKLKFCPSCDREIDIGYHICPHCQTYMSGLSDF